jgi:hypothetical protein
MFVKRWTWKATVFNSACPEKRSMLALVGRISFFSFLIFGMLCNVSKANDVRLQYDISGNIISIQEASAPSVPVLAIEDIRPGFGAIGETVTIIGTGFGSLTSSDTVAFNGASAVVTARSTTSLAVTVPVGATSGPVTITAGLLGNCRGINSV